MRKGIDCKGREWEENLNKIKPDKDLVGQVFGRLSVKFRVQNDKQGLSQWLTQCECGNEVVTRGSSLRTKHTKSCGCAQKEIVSEKLTKTFDIGEQIGYFTIIKRADGYLGKGAYWHVICRCGTEKIVQAEALRNGATVSCGCYHREEIHERQLIDLTGQRFGLLEVIQESDKKTDYGDIYWQCRCDCGNVENISGHNLRRGCVLSCGCLNMSNGEYYISNILKERNINYTHNRAYFQDLRNDEGNLLRYDFILLDEDNSPYRIIEFDGVQHEQPIDYFGGIESFNKLQQNDKIKNQYALSHNIPLVRIPYTKRNNIIFDDLLGDKYLIKGEI